MSNISTSTKIPLLTNNLKKRNSGFRRDNIEFTFMSLPAIILVFIFSYIPMFGLIVAFKNYRYDKGILGSAWSGFENFKFFFQSLDFFRIVRNTVCMNALFIISEMVAAIFVALLLFEIKRRFFVKTYQTVMLLPYFLSWVVVSIMVYALLNPQYGIINELLTKLGMQSISWYSEPKYWPIILDITYIWKGIGLDSVLFFAALMGINSELFEASAIDGANKLQTISSITLPSLVPLATILFLLQVGNIFRTDFGLFYQVTQNQALLYPVTDVIDTYVFRAVYDLHDFTMSSAVGLCQSVVGFITILSANFIVGKINEENALF